MSYLLQTGWFCSWHFKVLLIKGWSCETSIFRLWTSFEQELNAEIERCKFFYPVICVVYSLWSGHVTSSKPYLYLSPSICVPRSLSSVKAKKNVHPVLQCSHTNHPRNPCCFFFPFCNISQPTNCQIPKSPTQATHLIFNNIFHPLSQRTASHQTPCHCYLAKLWRLTSRLATDFSQTPSFLPKFFGAGFIWRVNFFHPQKNKTFRRI